MEKQKVINNYVLSIFTCGVLEVPVKSFRDEKRKSINFYQYPGTQSGVEHVR